MPCLKLQKCEGKLRQDVQFVGVVVTKVFYTYLPPPSKPLPPHLFISHCPVHPTLPLLYHPLILFFLSIPAIPSISCLFSLTPAPWQRCLEQTSREAAKSGVERLGQEFGERLWRKAREKATRDEFGVVELRVPVESGVQRAPKSQRVQKTKKTTNSSSAAPAAASFESS